ncbi:Ovule protein [Edwardsiella anguillarum]|uniref:Uncharacterized protein n=1 Tax=Edwardsiella piscicida TaxID=1263550 RepID=A0AAU8PK85_EDWPI|nr:hypothetical protein ETAE_2245 [Edwardsiella tarda EIB202]BET81258.1 Ovule protein [Edwardsiella anguillarum]BET84685.1 Ovule protein [Edwardsiella anguillarum]BET88050.1 Ovule protein [Edwardsiella anguillarum]BET91341.1 Ovule protein [Edwardsiella anguillarum]
MLLLKIWKHQKIHQQATYRLYIDIIPMLYVMSDDLYQNKSRNILEHFSSIVQIAAFSSYTKPSQQTLAHPTRLDCVR